MKSSKLLKLIILALFGTISFVLFFLNFPLPFMPPFLKVDFGDIPALIAALIFSPAAGILVVAIKNFLYLAIGGGDPVGVVANLLAGIMFILPVGLMYHRYKSVKSIVYGLVLGTVLTAFVMSIFNYLVLLPVYAIFMGIDEYAIESVKRVTVLFGVLPFNILKGIIVSLLFVPLFIKMRGWIDQKQKEFARV